MEVLGHALVQRMDAHGLRVRTQNKYLTILDELFTGTVKYLLSAQYLVKYAHSPTLVQIVHRVSTQ